MKRLRIETVAVRLSLSVEHEIAEFVNGELALRALLEDTLLEDEPASDVDDGLAGALQRRFKDRQPFGRVGLLVDGFANERFAEEACRFGEGARVSPLERGS